MADQDLNAANDGDLIKHCTLAEVLTRCSKEWDQVHFAETHAGAGLYNATSQVAPNDFISQLRKKVTDRESDSQNKIGTPYWNILSKWWSDDSKSGQYPGSSLQAAILLEQMLNAGTATIQATEYLKEVFNRLTDALRDFPNGIDLRHSGFQSEIEHLTDQDNLVLLIDPYGYSFGEEGVNTGQLSLNRLLSTIESCWKNKQACVVGFWCSTGRPAYTHKLRRLFSLTLQLYAEQHNAAYRRFARKSFSIEWLGMKKGKNIIQSLETGDWTNSWLKMGIRQEPIEFSVFAAKCLHDGSVMFQDMME